MNKLITNKITLILFAVIICHLTANAQDSTKKVIVVVRPGGITKIPASGTPASQSNNKNMASAPGAPGSGSLQKPVTAVPTGAVAAPAVAPASVAKAPVKQYVAPGSRSHTYASPSTSERAGTANYAPHAVVSPSKQGAPTGGMGTTGNAGKYAAAPSASGAVATPAVAASAAGASGTGNAGKYAAAAPSAPVSTAATPVVTPAVAPSAKKDTIAVAKPKTDTVATPPAKHTSNRILFAEIGGPGVAISVNYDQRFKAGQKDGFGFRAGVGYFAAGNNTVFTIPVQVNYLYGKDGKYLELGLGTTFINSKGDNYSSPTWEFDTVTGLAATAVIGVRYEPNNAINFRLGYVPIVSSYGLINAGGFSIGYTFN